MYNLPKPYISCSAYSLWKSSKDSFRKRYYLNKKPFETPETRFGKVIGKMLEDNEHHKDKFASLLINYPKKEFGIEVEKDGLVILGRLDQFDDVNLKIMELKTGHKDKKGNVPWDKLKVQKHTQLVWYSLLVELKFGKVHPEVILQWLETEFQIEEVEFDGHILSTKSRKLALIGEPKTFKRRIQKWERVKLLKEIFTVAREISDDYSSWQESQSSLQR